MMIFSYGDKKAFFLTACLSIVSSFSAVFSAYIMGSYINIATKGNIEQLQKIIMVTIAGLVFFYAIKLALGYATNQLIYSCNTTIKERLFQAALSPANQQSIKEQISLMTNDLKQLETKGLLSEVTILQNSLVFISAISYSFFLDIKTTIAFILASIVPTLVTKLFSKKIKKTSENWSQQNGKYVGKLTDYFSGIDTIINYGAETTANKDFKKSIVSLEGALKKMNNTVNVSSTTTYSVASIAVFGCAFGFGVYQVIQGGLSVGALLAITQVSNFIINPLLIVVTAVNDRKTAAETMDKIRKIRITEQEKMPSIDIELLQVEGGGITIDDKELFSHLDLTIEKGDKVLIAAPSGYGKSTLLKALAGFSSFSQGAYYVNDENTLTTNLQTSFSLIKQRPFIFDNTILFNLTMGNEYSEADIQAAVEASGMSDFVSEKGLDYPVGENGSNLSGGQLQRLEIGRGLLSHRSTILADEITSALDPEMSQKVSDYLLNSNLTLIEVAHKVSAEQLRKYTKVVYLDQLDSSLI
ncbi:ABC transporter transmembrane domain-containing protein [Vagococcus vulneris]|uniref:ABC transporter ATP-binding protein n=1 Tax=Vagococcus vulneris TaxID=1977869 RepID=A0A430A0B1_9ENTE|nr:ABC transporter ATP-binding protein [Vagococcus vulneris]RST99744.1 hypothetical protein CBF37_03195 [Vagococcus vulneris]